MLMIVRLSELDKRAILKHYRRLSIEAQRSRFFGLIDLEKRVEELDFVRDIFYGVRENGKLVALAEIRGGEIAYSVLKPRKGLGYKVAEAAIKEAIRQGYKELEAFVLVTNKASEALLKKLGFEYVGYDPDERSYEYRLNLEVYYA